MPTLTQLEYIVSVHKLKHFGRAAAECHVSQPSLSSQVQKVEEELGIIIFDRSKKPVMTTVKGEKVIEQARIVLNEHRKLKDFAREEGEIVGKFHLGVIPTLSSYIIPLFIESFANKYPKVNLKISEYKTEDIIQKLYDDELDGGIMVTPLYDDKLIEQSLFFEPFYVFSSDEHKFSKKKSVKDSELEGDTVWLLNEGHCFRNQVIRLCSLQGKNRVLDNISFESGNLETLKNLIRRGKGYTLLPELATLSLSKKEKEQNLKRFIAPVPTREVSLVHSRSFLKEDIINSLTSEIISSLPKSLKSLKRENVEVIGI